MFLYLVSVVPPGEVLPTTASTESPGKAFLSFVFFLWFMLFETIPIKSVHLKLFFIVVSAGEVLPNISSTETPGIFLHIFFYIFKCVFCVLIFFNCFIKFILKH
jgi:hypothetical protein